MIRIDQLAVDKGLFSSRTRAQDYIKEHGISIGFELVRKPGRKLPLDTELMLTTEPMKWVSRGALKLDYALENWDIPVKGTTVMDVGSSTGGWTEVLLENGAEKVVSIDTGSDQMHARLREDARVSLHEQSDIRNIEGLPLSEGFVADVSFISLKLILLSAIQRCKPGGWAVVLVKPQFEVGPDRVGKNGIVREEFVRRGAVKSIKMFAEALGCEVKAELDSPVTGGDGNKEYLLWLALPTDR